MNRQGFIDANGYEVTIGTLVEYQDKRFAEVTDLTQDGDVSLLFLDGERMQTKWRAVARLPKEIASQIHAARASSKSQPPVQGYTPQPDAKVALVNSFKEDEERLLRKLDAMKVESLAGFGGRDTVLRHDLSSLVIGTMPQGSADKMYTAPQYDQALLAEARKTLMIGFMLLNRAVFQPTRIKLPEDGE